MSKKDEFTISVAKKVPPGFSMSKIFFMAFGVLKNIYEIAKNQVFYVLFLCNVVQTIKRKNVVEIAFEGFVVVDDVHLNGLDSLVVESVSGEINHFFGLVGNDEFVEVG